MKRTCAIVAMLLLFLPAVKLLAGEAVPEIPAADFQRLYDVIRPQKGESPWREIAWLTNITEARERAIAEDKPIIIFTAADGSPLSRT